MKMEYDKLPNALLIMTHNQGWDDFGLHGNDSIFASIFKSVRYCTPDCTFIRQLFNYIKTGTTM